MEQFKEIPGYEGLYEASNLGDIISLPKQYGKYISKRKVMKPQKHPKGHYIISLKNQDGARSFWIARIIAKLFVKNPKPKEYTYVNHKDLDKYNNHFENLEWCNQSQNVQHSWDNNPTRKSSNTKIGLFNKRGKMIREWPTIKNCAKRYKVSARSIRRWIIAEKLIGKKKRNLRYL